MNLKSNNAKILNIVGNRLIHYSTNFQHIPEIISNRDLYKNYAKENKIKGTSADTFSRSLYPRSVVEFESDFLDYKDLGNTRILDVSKLDADFKVKIEPRINEIQRFVGSDFELSLNEKLSIICGLSNFELEIPNKVTQTSIHDDFASKSITVSSSRLRKLGKSIYQLHIGLSTVFASHKFLSLSSGEIESSLELFSDEKKLIPLFMKKNLLYNSIIPFKGAMKSGPIHSLHEYENLKSKIHDSTSIGSFYTMLGILTTKFDKEKVVQGIINEKILEGSLGLIGIAMEGVNVNRK